MKISITAEKTKQPTLIKRMGIIPNAPNRTPPIIMSRLLPLRKETKNPSREAGKGAKQTAVWRCRKARLSDR